VWDQSIQNQSIKVNETPVNKHIYRKMKDKNKKRKEPVKSRLRQENLKAIKVYSKVNVVDFLHLQQ